jgi:hypothetical protein
MPHFMLEHYHTAHNCTRASTTRITIPFTNKAALYDFLNWWRAPQQMLWTTAALRLSVQLSDEDDFFFRFFVQWSTGGMKLTGENWSARRKTCPSATLYATNPTYTDPVLNPALRGERPATNSLTHGTALFMIDTIHDHKMCVTIN